MTFKQVSDWSDNFDLVCGVKFGQRTVNLLLISLDGLYKPAVFWSIFQSRDPKLQINDWLALNTWHQSYVLIGQLYLPIGWDTASFFGSFSKTFLCPTANITSLVFKTSFKVFRAFFIRNDVVLIGKFHRAVFWLVSCTLLFSDWLGTPYFYSLIGYSHSSILWFASLTDTWCQCLLVGWHDR